MASDTTLRESISRSSRIPIDLIGICRDHESLEIGKHRRAIVFVYAVWSGPCLLAFQRLTEALAMVPASAFTLYTVDADDFTRTQPSAVLDAFMLTGAMPHGYGESLWIHDGSIKAALSRASSTCDVSQIQALVADLVN